LKKMSSGNTESPTVGNKESAQEAASLSAETRDVEKSLMCLFREAKYQGFEENPELDSTREMLKGIDVKTQEKLAQDFLIALLGNALTTIVIPTKYI